MTAPHDRYRCRVPNGTIGETYLVVPVPAADPAVRTIDGHDALPAHVTALGPFAPPPAITRDLLKIVGGITSDVMPWDSTFTRVRAFDDGTLWLAPEDDTPFRALTRALWGRFPNYPPYGGAFADVIPHLTLQEQSTLSRPDAGARVASMLPISHRVDRLELWVVHADGIEVAAHWTNGPAMPS